MFVPNPNYNANIPALTPTTPNHADYLNAQLQGILDRLQAAYDEIPAIAAQQVNLQNQFANLGTTGLSGQLDQVQSEIAALTTQNDALIARLATIQTSLSGLTGKVTGLTNSTTAIAADANEKQVGTNIQAKDTDLEAIAGLALQASTAIAVNNSGDVFLAAMPNLGIAPPTIYQCGWSLTTGANSGFAAGQTNTWVVVPLVEFYNGGGYSLTGNRVNVASGIYQINAQTCGVGCVEIACQLLSWVGGTSTLVGEGTIGRTVSSGGNIGSSWTVKSYIVDTVVLPSCQLELQTRFKTAHSTVALSGGMPVSLGGQNEDYASLTLVKIG